MAKRLILLAIMLALCWSCQKRAEVREQPPGSSLDQGVINHYREQARVPVSASFISLSASGSFQGELYLEPGETTLSLVYGYMSLGRSLFEFKLMGRDFLYLDLAGYCAYSNRKDWLKDYVVGAGMGDQDRMALALIRALQALAGDIPEQCAVSRDKSGRVIAAWPGGPEPSVRYVFSPDPVRLLSMESGRDDSSVRVEFEYGSTCWFPKSIRVSGPGASALVRMDKATCPESSRPKINFEIPPGFVNILLSDR